MPAGVWSRVLLRAPPIMVFLLAAALSRRSKLIGIELCRWTLMEINRNQITDRLRQRNSGARTTRARLSLYSALSVYDQHAFLSSRFVRFLLSRERAFSTSVATRIPASAPERDEETPSRAPARACGIALESAKRPLNKIIRAFHG